MKHLALTALRLRQADVQVAAELGAKSPTSNGDLLPEEKALFATDFVQEMPFDTAAYGAQQLRLEASSHGSQPEPTASSPSHESNGSQNGQDTVQPPHLHSGSSSCPPHLVPTHSYRHGRVQQDSITGRTAVSKDEVAAELQPA